MDGATTHEWPFAEGSVHRLVVHAFVPVRHCGRTLELFPYTVVHEATLAAKAIAAAYGNSPSNAGSAANSDSSLTGPTVKNHAGIQDGSLFLISGGADYLPEESATGSCLAWLMDRNGHLRHVWEYDRQLWTELKQVKRAPVNSVIRPIGLHLYEDGGLLVSFQGINTFPYAVGLARFDRDSRLLWKKERFNHHWFSVAADGRIYIGGMHIAESPLPIGKTAAEIHSDDRRILADSVMILDSQGNLLEEISMLDALIDSGWVGLFQGATDTNIDAFTRDPTHLNDVRLITAEMAEQHELLAEGDLLLSFRSLNTIGILDGTTHRFKWLCSGATIRQHSPRLVAGGILIFDNRGGPATTGGSRLVRIDLDTRLPTTLFPRPDVPLPENTFFTDVAGYIDLSSSTRALVALSEVGDVWEVDLETGKVLWQYTFFDPKTNRRRPIYTAKYVHAPSFPLNRREQESVQ